MCTFVVVLLCIFVVLQEGYLFDINRISISGSDKYSPYQYIVRVHNMKWLV